MPHGVLMDNVFLRFKVASSRCCERWCRRRCYNEQASMPASEDLIRHKVRAVAIAARLRCSIGGSLSPKRMLEVINHLRTDRRHGWSTSHHIYQRSVLPVRIYDVQESQQALGTASHSIAAQCPRRCPPAGQPTGPTCMHQFINNSISVYGSAKAWIRRPNNTWADLLEECHGYVSHTWRDSLSRLVSPVSNLKRLNFIRVRHCSNNGRVSYVFCYNWWIP